MASSKKTAKRDLLILVRYTIKKDYAPKGLHAGDVVLLVRNDQGREYYVTLRRNKAHSCTCSAGQHSRKCYHVSTMVELENARYAATKALKVVSKPAQQEVSPVEPTPLRRDMLNAPLNGSRVFSLLKVS